MHTNTYPSTTHSQNTGWWVLSIILAVAISVSGSYFFLNFKKVVEPELTARTAEKVLSLFHGSEKDVVVAYVSEPTRELPQEDPFVNKQWSGVACKIVKWHSGTVEKQCHENTFSSPKLTIETYEYENDGYQMNEPLMVSHLDRQ